MADNNLKFGIPYIKMKGPKDYKVGSSRKSTVALADISSKQEHPRSISPQQVVSKDFR